MNGLKGGKSKKKNKSDILPQVLKIAATADDGTIMAVRHKQFFVKGVQKFISLNYKKPIFENVIQGGKYDTLLIFEK